MENLKEFKELILRYESIKLDEITRVFDNVNFELKHLTGFGACSTCSLCISVDANCDNCVYVNIEGDTCSHGSNLLTYNAIDEAQTPEDLLQAYRNRAIHMRGLLEYEKSKHNENSNGES